MAVGATDVPDRFDLVLTYGGNSYGFMLDDALESSFPFRVHRATSTYTPTFITRQNVSGNYGDNQSDFFLTASQNDWSLGEQQRYFRSSDGDSIRRYWQGSSVDATLPGQITLRPTVSSLTFSEPVSGCVGTASNLATTPIVWVGGTTNLFTVDPAGTITSKGAHGCDGGVGVPVGQYAIAAGPSGAQFQSTIYMAKTGGTLIRQYNETTATFASFSAAAGGPYALAYVGNTLYGLSASSFLKYDTAGTATTVFTWKNPAGTSLLGIPGRITGFGGKVLILWTDDSEGASSLWLYDGTGVSKLGFFAPNFFATDLEVVGGTAFVSGAYVRSTAAGNLSRRPAVFYYANGSIGELWKSDAYSSTGDVVGLAAGAATLAAYEGGLLIGDPVGGKLYFYSPASGGVHTVGALATSITENRVMRAGPTFVVQTRGSTAASLFPNLSTYPSSTTVTSSLFDFDNSLTKYFRGVTVEWEAATDGNGGSVDVAYQLDSITGNYTSLATGVTSGAETTFAAATTGRAISLKLTLNKGTSTAGPVLKRVKVRAAPIQTRFPMRTYVLNCAGDAGKGPLTLRDGTPSPKTGREMADALVTAAALTVPMSATDRFGTYTCVVDDLSIFEVHPGIENPSAETGEFIAELKLRGV